VATILIISSTVKRLLWWASPLAWGQILFRGQALWPPLAPVLR